MCPFIGFSAKGQGVPLPDQLSMLGAQIKVSQVTSCELVLYSLHPLSTAPSQGVDKFFKAT